MSEAAELGIGDTLAFAGGKVKITDYSKDPPPKTYSRSLLSADPDQRVQAAMRKQVEALKEAKRFPDNEQGAIQALLSMADPREIKSTNIAKANPDPQVEGVWEILFKKPIPGGDTKAIVYLAGYPDPFGKIRAYDDFETGQGLNESFGPMVGPQIGSAPRSESPNDPVTWPKEIRTDEYDWPDGKPEDDDEFPIFDLDEKTIKEEGESTPSGTVTSDAFDAAPFDAGHNWKKDAQAQGLTESQLEQSAEAEIQDLYAAGTSISELYSTIRKRYRLSSREAIDIISRALRSEFEDDYDSRYELEGLEETILMRLEQEWADKLVRMKKNKDDAMDLFMYFLDHPAEAVSKGFTDPEEMYPDIDGVLEALENYYSMDEKTLKESRGYVVYYSYEDENGEIGNDSLSLAANSPQDAYQKAERALTTHGNPMNVEIEDVKIDEDPPSNYSPELGSREDDVPIITSVKMWNEGVKKNLKEARIGSVIDKILDKAPTALKEPLRFAGVVTRDDKTPFRNKREIYNTIYNRLNQYGKEHPESKIRYDANEDKMYGLTPEQVRAITTIVDADNKAWDQALAKGKNLDSKQIVQLYYSLLQRSQQQTNRA
jgi:hypothetical protein